MTTPVHTTTYRKDYTAPDYIVDSVHLRFELGEETTCVTSKLSLRANYPDTRGQRPLKLDGHRFVLCGIRLDGAVLEAGRYTLTTEHLIIPSVPSAFTLEIETKLSPQDNTFLEGLYRSSGMFCTQCEAEGFRSITYYPDRPDVLAVFTTTIVANRSQYPVLLSNGNLIDGGKLENGQHFATWHDPFRKPSYLFALVAGNLACLRSPFVTCSGREVELRIYAQEHNIGKCGHALESLKNAMRWDEAAFGREYDLDVFMIVAVDDFNMGAMENKGLNIFNSRYVLASPETATDDDYQAIESVIGHEYFHNWSGNRVTCRDWFQLSLKEGLTIFRDQEFSSDMHSRGVKRIQDVRVLRAGQFAEDAGPLSHPVRPDSYMEINNFYTATVYNKGAEVIRMMRTILGPERFRDGMDLYFRRHDGRAATVDDFVAALSEASGANLDLFQCWYSQSGTPVVEITGTFDANAGELALHVRQTCPATPGQPVKAPFPIPITMGLLDREGKQLPVTLARETEQGPTTRVILARKQEETFTFSGLAAPPTPALLRGFSAPVKLVYPYGMADFTTLMAHEPDPFCRWEAGQTLAARQILANTDRLGKGELPELSPDFVDAYSALLSSGMEDMAFLAEMLLLPTEKYLCELVAVIDPDAIHNARRHAMRSLAKALGATLLDLYHTCRAKHQSEPDGAGRRRMGNICLAYLMATESQEIIDICLHQYYTATNMTDTVGAIVPLVSCDCPERHQVVDDFYQQWRHNRQVLDKWFSIQATSNLPGTIDVAEKLIKHPDFELTNPNRFRSLVGAFSQNHVRFHAGDGAGYRFVTEQLLRLIPLNPQVSARLLGPLTTWRRYDATRQALMREQLEQIANLANLPREVYEVVTKSLQFGK